MREREEEENNNNMRVYKDSRERHTVHKIVYIYKYCTRQQTYDSFTYCVM